MTTYVFFYDDEKVVSKDFSSWKEAVWYAHNEGDHLRKWGTLADAQEAGDIPYGN